MKNLLQSLAENLGMVFSYGRRDHLNLLSFDQEDNDIRFLLFPLKVRSVFSSDSGSVNRTTWIGSFMVLQRSDLDSFYNEQKGNSSEGKYEKHIEPIKTALDTLLNQLICNQDYIVQNWDMDEVINLFDMNADGIMVTFTISTS